MNVSAYCIICISNVKHNVIVVVKKYLTMKVVTIDRCIHTVLVEYIHIGIYYHIFSNACVLHVHIIYIYMCVQLCGCR